VSATSGHRPAGKGSRLNLNVKAGRQYSIIVDGANGAAGAYQLRVTPP
jgi:hypothetical protein